jgi:hypothetical protein
MSMELIAPSNLRLKRLPVIGREHFRKSLQNGISNTSAF